MRLKKIVSTSAIAYSLTRPDNLLQISSFRRAFVFAYFHYGKLFEDAFWRLVQRQPELFQAMLFSASMPT